MSICKEHILPAVNNYRASPILFEPIERININYTQNTNKSQAQIVTAFSSPIHKCTLVYNEDNEDKLVVIYWIAKMSK